MQTVRARTGRRVCVFCGSGDGFRAEYRGAARALGHALAEAGLGIVYGGAQVGMMGALADAALTSGGEVIGVIPRDLQDRELAHHYLSRLYVVESMHERKAKMVEESDAFLALPGGFGTLDEFFEVLTWAQLGIHKKPCLLLNTQGYFEPLLAFLDKAVQQGFIKREHRSLIHLASEPGEIVPLLDSLWQVRGLKMADPETGNPKIEDGGAVLKS